MTVTNIFYYVVLGVTLFFVICVVLLLMWHFTIYERVNKNFRMVKDD